MKNKSSFVGNLTILAWLVTVLVSPLRAVDCPVGDLDGDCGVDLVDLAILADSWLTSEDLCKEQGLMLHLRLDEYTGNIAVDSAGLHNGTVIGSAQWHPTEGLFEGALDLDGVDDHIVVKDYKGVGGAGARTCSAWSRRSS